MTMLTPLGVGGHAPVRRSRGRRRFLKTVVVLLLLGALAAGGWQLFLRDDPAARAATPTPRRSCPAPSPAPTALPPAQVRVNVYNATERRGLAATVATALSKRAFRVVKVGNDPAGRTVTGTAEVRSSSIGAGAARTVGSQVDGVVAVPDQRRDASVDLVLGASFKTLRTPAGAAAALVPTPAPSPSGC